VTRARIAGVVAAGALVIASAVGVAAPAGAGTSSSVSARNTRFCNILTNGGSVDLGSTDPNSAQFATQQIDKLLRAHPPSKVKKALKTIRSFYKSVHSGDVSVPSGGALKAFTTFTRYVITNCRSTTPST